MDSGNLEVYYDPAYFTWLSFAGKPFISVMFNGREGYLRVNKAAVCESGFKPGDRVKVGYNRKRIALARAENGAFLLTAKKGGKKSCGGLFIRSGALVRKLKELGLVEGGDRLPCVWDGRSGMLVAVVERRPDGDGGSESGGDGKPRCRKDDTGKKNCGKV